MTVFANKVNLEPCVLRHMSRNSSINATRTAGSTGQNRFFSIVVPLYNKEKSIKTALNSVLTQSHGAFEVVVIDDGSTDSSASVAAAVYDKRIRLIRQPNSGASLARNAGVNNARADYIAFIDADDYWEPDFLESISRLIDICPGAGLFATAYRREHANGKILRPKLEPSVAAMPPGRMHHYFRAATFGEQPFMSSSVCISREAFNGVGGFKPGIKYGEDLDMFARIALRYTIMFTPEPKVSWRRTGESCTIHGPMPLIPWAFHEDVRKLLASDRLSPEIARDLIEHLARVDLYTVMANILNSDRQAVLAFLSGIKTTAFARKKLLIWLLMQLPLPLRQRIIAARDRL